MNQITYMDKWIKTPDISQVLAMAQNIKAQMHAMWANDSEFWDIDSIVWRVRNWALDTVTAILNMQNIMNSKQAYH